MARRSTVRTCDPDTLYGAMPFLGQEARRKLGLTFTVPFYYQDPLVAKKLQKVGLGELELNWEPGLGDGPTNARLAVVDLDVTGGVLHPPAHWDSATCRFDVPASPAGLALDDPVLYQFHQVNAWAGVQNTLGFFEQSSALGRAIPWAFPGNRLTISPHAMREQNAYYDRSRKALLLGYFGPSDDPVYSCLSHDIITHETGHAILDGIRPYYNEVDSPQTDAFHEFIADLTAVIMALSHKQLRHVVADATGGDLSVKNIIAPLAEQFGEAVYGDEPGAGAVIREADNKLTMAEIAGEWEAHTLSQVLTGAAFEILTAMSVNLMRTEGKTPREALWKAIDDFSRLALRALDYCPPCGIQFEDYGQAVLRAHELAYPLDPHGYGPIVADVFARRGIVPAPPTSLIYPVQFRRYDVERISGSRTAAYHLLNSNRPLLHIPWSVDIEIVDLYDTDKALPGGRRLPREIVIEYVWREDVRLHGPEYGTYSGETVPLWCGGTLVFDDRGNVLSFVHKPGTKSIAVEDVAEGKVRRERLRNTYAQKGK